MLVTLVTLEDWKQERELRYEVARECTRLLSYALRRAAEVEEVIARIETEMRENTEFSQIDHSSSNST